MLIIGVVIGLDLLRFELAIVWTMYCPSLVSREPIISLVFNLLGV